MRLTFAVFISCLSLSGVVFATTESTQNIAARSYMYGPSLQNGFLLSQKKTKKRTAFMLSRLQDGKVIRIQILPQKVYTNLSTRLAQIESVVNKTNGNGTCKQVVSVSLENTNSIPHYCLDSVNKADLGLIHQWLQEATDYTSVAQ